MQKIVEFFRGRRGLFKKTRNKFTESGRPVAWFHCASLGEFEQARPVLESFKNRYPDYTILLTFFSPSGYEVRKDYDKADYVGYLPIDTPFNAKKFLDLVQPTIVLWTKYDYWYFILHEIHKRKIPLILFSAIFRKEQLFFRWYAKGYRAVLKKFTHIFVQNSASKELLQSIDVQNVDIAPDTRFDRVWEIAQNSADFPEIEKFKNQTPLLVVGSSWSEDLEVVLSCFKKFPYPLKLIIAPHEIHSSSALKAKLQREAVLFSEIKASQWVSENLFFYNILIIDNMGMLSSLYRYADYAFVGGGFKQGLHNILEPAVFGKPIFFGNKAYKKFQEASDLISLQGAFAIKNVEDFLEVFQKVYNIHSKTYQDSSDATKKYIQENTGGKELILEYVKKVL